MDNNKIVVVEEPKTLSFDDIANIAKSSTGGFFTDAAFTAGVIDSPLKAREQLTTDDVVMKLLHIEEVNITRAVNEDGSISSYPVIAFVEYPSHYYTAGSRTMQVVVSWAKAAGDEFTYNNNIFEGNFMLPKLNDMLENNEKPAVVFRWKKGKKNKYVDLIILAG